MTKFVLQNEVGGTREMSKTENDADFGLGVNSHKAQPQVMLNTKERTGDETKVFKKEEERPGPGEYPLLCLLTSLFFHFGGMIVLLYESNFGMSLMTFMTYQMIF